MLTRNKFLGTLLGFAWLGCEAQTQQITQTVILNEITDIFQNQSQTFTLSKTPMYPPKVFVNGVLMALNIDYTYSGNNLVFSLQQIGDTPIIQVIYFAVN